MQSHKEDTNRKVRRDGTQIYMKERHTPRSIPIKEDLLYSRHEAAPHRPTRPGILYGLLGPLECRQITCSFRDDINQLFLSAAFSRQLFEFLARYVLCLFCNYSIKKH